MKKNLANELKKNQQEVNAIIKELKKERLIFGNQVNGKTLYSLTAKGIGFLSGSAYIIDEMNGSRRPARSDTTVCMGCERVVSLKEAKTKWDEQTKTWMALCSDCYERIGFPE